MKTRSQKLAQAAIQVVSSWSSAGARTLNVGDNNDVQHVAPPQTQTTEEKQTLNLENLFHPAPEQTPRYAEYETHAQRDQVDIKKQELSQFARRFPALVQSSGLLPAFAFARTKNETYAEGFRKVLAVLAPEIANAQLTRCNDPDFSPTQRRLFAVEQKLSKTNAEEYMRLSRNALEASTWIKRYATSGDN